MCGIVGVVFEKTTGMNPTKKISAQSNQQQPPQARDDTHLFHYLFNSLFYLQMRGQDSVGLCTMDPTDGTLTTSKHSVNAKDNPQGKYIFDLLREDVGKHFGDVGIGHTRHATIGSKNNENAHPHLSNDSKIAVVHNGHIDNCLQLIALLKSKKFKFAGQSDSELIPNYLQYLCEQYPGDTFCEVIGRLQQHLQGKWACLVLFSQYPDTVFFFKNRMPLVVSQASGKYKNKTVLLSDPQCFLEKFPEYISIGDYMVGFVSKDRIYMDSKNYKVYPNDMDRTDSVFIDFEKNYFNTRTIYTLQNLDNIYETICNVQHEYKVSRQMLIKETRFVPGIDNIVFHTLAPHAGKLSDAKSITLVGGGTSYHVVQAIKTVLQQYEIFDKVLCLDALNFSVYDLLGDTIYFVVSQTSENKYIEKVVDTITTLYPTAFIVGVFNNVLATYVRKKLRAYVLLNAGIEFSLSFVKDYTSQYFCLYLLAGYLAQLKKKKVFYKELNYIFQELQYDVSYVIKNQHFFRDLSLKIHQCCNILVVGGNDMMPFACEVALKFREIAYMNAFALHYNQLHNGYHHVLQKKTFILVLHDRNQNHTDFTNFVHKLLLDHENLSTDFKSLIFSNELTPWPSSYNNCDCTMDTFFDVFPFQMSQFNSCTFLVAAMYLAYYVANARGINPDRPRAANCNFTKPTTFRDP